MSYINFTVESFKELKQEYEKALEAKLEVFKFKGNDLDINYAKYLIEYLTPKFENKR